MALPVGRTGPYGRDGVWLEDIQVSGVVGPDAWHRSGRPQPIHISVKVPISYEEAGITDDLNGSIHYGRLAKSIMELFNDQAAPFASLGELVEAISKKALLEFVQANSLELVINLPEALLLADGLGLSTHVSKIEPPPGLDNESRLQSSGLKLYVKDLRLNCIIGINPHERREKQPVVVNLEFWNFERHLLVEYDRTVKKISVVRLRFIAPALLISVLTFVQTVEASSCETLEALANSIAKTLVLSCPVKMTTVSVHKPRAITEVKKAGVTVTRTRDFYDAHTNGTITPP